MGHAGGIAFARRGGLTGGAGALVAPAVFTTAPTSGGVFTAPPSWLSISCVTTGRTAQTSASTLVTGIGADAWRARNVGLGQGLSVERAATQALVSGTPLTWNAPNAGGMIQSGGHPDPTGGSGASMLFQSGGGNFSSFWIGVTGQCLSSWALAASGSGALAHLRQNANGTWVDVTSSMTTWTRISVTEPSSVSDAFNFETRAVPTGAPLISGATSWYGYGAQLEAGMYPTSVLPNESMVRAADVLSTTANIAPGGRLNMAMTFAPNFATAEQGADSPLLWWDGNNQVFLRQSDAKVCVKVGGSVVLTSAALTWSREHGLAVGVHLVASGALSLTVAGATTGNGTTNASGVAAFTTQSTAYILGTSSGAQECNDLRAISFARP